MDLDTQKKASKGTVTVEEFRGRLRLRWRYLTKQYTLAIGLPNSPINQKAAQQKANRIELDLASDNFDPTLKKYKPKLDTQNTQISVVALFQQFMEHKSKIVSPKTIKQEYNATLGYLERFFEGRAASRVGVAEAQKFTQWFKDQKLQADTIRIRQILIKGAWVWAIKAGHLKENPWTDIHIKSSVKQPPKPFTKDEIEAIILAFRKHPYHSPYADYVAFLFGTGCRTSECIGLQWKHISADCTTIWIGETLTAGVRQGTKTGKTRTLTLPPRLQQLLQNRRPLPVNLDQLVFLSPQGKPISAHNFRSRPWKSILQSLKIDYRKPYTTRATLISHALELGMNPVMVAQLTGHDVQTLYQNYAGSVNSRPRLPEF